MEKWLNNRNVYNGKIFAVCEGEIKTGKGQVYPRQVVVNPGGVGIVAVVDRHVILVRQFRIAIGKHLLELPAGRLEPNETPEMSARRELIEEVGFTAGKFELLAQYYSSAGFCTEKMYVYLATGLEKTQARPEIDEDLEIVQLSLPEVKSMLERGEFEDAKTIIGLRELLLRMETRYPDR